MNTHFIRHTFNGLRKRLEILLCILIPAALAHTQTTQWEGLSSDWRNPTNWNNGVPNETTNVIISVGSQTGRIDPIVPHPLANDTPRVKNLTVQSGGRLTFASQPQAGILIVNGTDRLQNDGAIVLESGTILFKNSISFHHGGVFDAGSGTLFFSGLVWNNMPVSTFIPGTSTVVFYGTSNQTINGNITFYNLQVNTNGTLTFNGTVNVIGTISVGTGCSIVSSQSWRIEGTMTRNFTGTETGIQFLMSPDNYVDIEVPGITSITIESFPDSAPPEIPPSADTARSVRLRYYQITNVTGSGTVTLRLDYLTPEMGSLYTQTAGTFWKKNALGQAWINQGAELAGPNFVHKTSMDVSTLAGFYSLAENNIALPIQLAYFTANVVNGNNVFLEWMTITEVNNYGFYVQKRRQDEIHFIEIGFIPGHGTTTEPQYYSWIDENLAPGTYEYRLRQVDLGGSQSFSGIITVTVDNPTGVRRDDGVPALFKLDQNYPNPFNPTTTISFTLAEPNVSTLKVYNILAQEVSTLFSERADAGRLYTVQFDASHLPSGVYFYRLLSGSHTATHKMVLSK